MGEMETAAAAAAGSAKWGWGKVVGLYMISWKRNEIDGFGGGVVGGNICIAYMGGSGGYLHLHLHIITSRYMIYNPKKHPSRTDT